MESVKFNLEYIKDYIIRQLRNNCTFLFNELDLQMFIARALTDEFKNGYRIHLEYRLPKKWNKAFDDAYERWGETPYFDIVLERTGNNPSFIPIELKYKLKAVKLDNGERNFTRFGEAPSDEESGKDKITLATNQSAEDEGRYDFWKDVKRIELLAQNFSAVEGGIALFLTNQRSYMSKNEGNKCSKFNLTDEVKEGFLFWDYKDSRGCGNSGCCGDSECEQIKCGQIHKEKYKNVSPREWKHFKRPNFRLNGSYKGVWISGIDMKIDNKVEQEEKFYCYSVVVQKNNLVYEK